MGNYRIFCTEYCGDQHSNMIAVLSVVDDNEYSEFLTEVDFDDSIPLSEAGKNIYTKGCNACHSIDGTDMVGPTWKNLYGAKREFTDGTNAIADEKYLKESILYPQRKDCQDTNQLYHPIKVCWLIKKRIDAIIEYIKELSK